MIVYLVYAEGGDYDYCHNDVQSGFLKREDAEAECVRLTAQQELCNKLREEYQKAIQEFYHRNPAPFLGDAALAVFKKLGKNRTKEEKKLYDDACKRVQKEQLVWGQAFTAYGQAWLKEHYVQPLADGTFWLHTGDDKFRVEPFEVKSPDND